MAVADRPLAVGATLAPDMVRLVPVDAGFEGLSSLITDSQLPGLEGWLMQRSVPEGGLIEASALTEPGGGEGLRSMSVPVGIEHASGGTLQPGDRVDVVSVVDGVAGFVATDLEVIGVSDSSRSAIGSTAGYHVILAVEAATALSLAEAIDDGSVEVIESTGARSVDPDNGP